MTEVDLVKKIRELRQIRPSKDWVSLTKSHILGESDRERVSVSFFPVWKPVLATITVFGILFCLFTISQNSLPGDLLYPIKKIVERSQAVFVSQDELPAFQLKLANERLEDLAKASARNLALTINEFQVSISEAAKNLAKMDATTSSPVVIKKIVEETKKLERGKQKAESLGVVIGGTEELENAMAKVVGNLIEDLKTQTLTEKKAQILEEMEKLFEEEKYSEALELYLTSR